MAIGVVALLALGAGAVWGLGALGTGEDDASEAAAASDGPTDPADEGTEAGDPAAEDATAGEDAEEPPADAAPAVWRDYEITGVVPAGTELVDLGVRVNIECDCRGPADILLDRFALTLDGVPVEVPNGDFARGGEDWGYDGTATVSFDREDGRDVMSIEAAPSEWLYLNNVGVTANPGTRLELTITALVGADTSDAGYFDVIFLGASAETQRLVLPFDDRSG